MDAIFSTWRNSVTHLLTSMSDTILSDCSSAAICHTATKCKGIPTGRFSLYCHPTNICLWHHGPKEKTQNRERNRTIKLEGYLTVWNEHISLVQWKHLQFLECSPGAHQRILMAFYSSSTSSLTTVCKCTCWQKGTTRMKCGCEEQFSLVRKVLTKSVKETRSNRWVEHLTVTPYAPFENLQLVYLYQLKTVPQT